MNRDRINELYAGMIFSPEIQRTARKRIHWICRQVKGEKVLDIGCSQGIVCLLIGREGCDCIGVDYEKAAIDYARKELEKEEEVVRKRVQFQLAEASRLPFKECSFDTVILGEVLEHLAHPERVLKEAKRVLREGGKAVITVPVGLNPDSDHKRTYYYPRSFLKETQPFFETDSIDTLNNYIIYTGVNNASYDISQVPRETLLLEELRFQEKVEERCLSNEQALFDKTKQSNEQIKALKEQIVSLSKTNKGLEDALSAKARELEARDKALKDTLAAKEEELKAKLDAKEIALRSTLSYHEDILKHAWKWRIGSVFVEGYILVRDFVNHPFQFSKEVGRRFKEYYYAVNTGALPEKKKEGKLRKAMLNQKAADEHALMRPPDVHLDKKKRNIKEEKITISFGCILDEFTTACFQPECRLITFRPDNWKEILDKDPPLSIFVESAWRGNEGAWQYRIAKYSRNMGDELLHVLAWAKEQNIPSLFWNKEDPSHFERFIDKAKLFDYVFTSDADCIPLYRKETGHERIYALPFAAQPQIHNPVLEHPRQHNICFAGTYYGASHEERRRDMEFILKPSLSLGLHIYDRQHGMKGPDAAQFCFPDIYQSAIKGRFDYEDMVKAYKNYKVFLNINSVKTSPTMFSRRVFELLACGTPVISTYSKGIEELIGSDIVLVTESEADTKRHLENLLNDDDYWGRLSVKGIRKVMEDHIYYQRLQYICDCTGLNFTSLSLTSFSIISKVKDYRSIENLRNSLIKQTYGHFDVILFLEDKGIEKYVQHLRNSLPEKKIRSFQLLSSSAYEESLRCAEGEYVAVFDCADYYGSNYLKDYALALMYSKSDYIGKHTHFTCTINKEKLNAPGKEFQFVSEIPTSTLAVKKEIIDAKYLPTLLNETVFMNKEMKILSLDKFNYMKLSQSKTLDVNTLKLLEI